MLQEQVTPNNIIIVAELARSSRYVIHKAQRGSKFIVLKSPVHNDYMMTEMLRHEFELGQTLSHPSIVNTLEFIEDANLGPAIVMEYVDGVTLDRFISHNTPISVRRRVLDDILSGIEYLHHRAIYHNDLKPSNIIVNRNGTARILDFGLSLSDDSAYRGCYGGTEGFTAPEILQGRGSCGCSSDIYSLGKIIEFIYGGSRLNRVVNHCCKEDASVRYGSVADLRIAIQRHHRRPLKMALLALLAVIVVVVGYTYISQQMAKQQANDTRQRIEREMVLFYEPIKQLVERQPYKEFAQFAMSDYYIALQEYIKAQPSDNKLMVEEIFARQIDSLNSIALNKPSIDSLADSLRQICIAKINKGELY